MAPIDWRWSIPGANVLAVAVEESWHYGLEQPVEPASYHSLPNEFEIEWANELQLNPAIPDPKVTEIRQYRMLNLGPFKSFLFTSYIGNNENPPITDGICWSRYCGVNEWVSEQANRQASIPVLTSIFLVVLDHSVLFESDLHLEKN